MSLFEQIYANLIKGGAWLTILNGLWATVRISALSLLLGTLLGALICAMRMSRITPLRWLAKAYIAVLRGSPVLMLLMLMYYVVLARSPLDAEYVAVIAFGLNVSAHIAELMRSALSAADKGQAEAARTLGFSRLAAFRLVTLPQAARIAKPVYQSTIINLIQWTSVVGYVTITDLTRVINNISARTMQPLFMIVTGMLLYLGLAYIVYGLFVLSSRRKKRRKGGEAA
ncbi:MAG: amino acid ABC transporter permease [Eubacteriales bacterium]|nr:amino acid ABC transporter permease [Eubacteriales bacterium]MDD3881853.1 amino acid ABC transporter permease [Eubacteriales bacterium]MDD4512901.1 amino acid ABC transporter permease [Eubacteriales bacterium]